MRARVPLKASATTGPTQGRRRTPAPAPAPATQKHAISASSQQPRRLLIADDNEDAAESLAVLLRLQGHDVTVVGSGREALDAIGRLLPDVALLDISMPDISGYEVARRWRQVSRQETVRLIAVTGWGQDRDKRRALEAGFDYHFTKPIESEALLDLLREADAAS